MLIGTLSKVRRTKVPSGVIYSGADWTPAQLGSSLVAYLDPMDAAPTLNNGNIASQPNASFAAGGSSWNLSQGTATAQPAYSATGFNGYPGFTTDGVDDLMVAPGTALAQPHTRMTLVSTTASLPANSYLFSSAGAGPEVLYLTSTTNFYMYAGSDGPIGPVVANAFYCTTEIYNGASSLGNLNGDADVTVSPGVTTPQGVAVTPGGNLSLRVATIAIINRGLNSSERAKLRGYMIWRRGLSAILPSNDPYKSRPPRINDP